MGTPLAFLTRGRAWEWIFESQPILRERRGAEARALYDVQDTFQRRGTKGRPMAAPTEIRWYIIKESPNGLTT